VSDLITWTQGLSAEAIHEHDIIPWNRVESYQRIRNCSL
jgi:hypothetical protein